MVEVTVSKKSLQGLGCDALFALHVGNLNPARLIILQIKKASQGWADYVVLPCIPMRRLHQRVMTTKATWQSVMN